MSQRQVPARSPFWSFVSWLSWGLLSLALAGSCASSGARRGGPAGDLVVASDLDNPPFAWVDEDGVPRGRDVEMMGLVAEVLGRKLVWERMPFDELLDAAAQGQVDAVCATLGITPERAERVLFSPPYFTTVQAVVVRGGAGEPRSLDDLVGRVVAAGQGTTSERAARERLAASHLDPGRKGASSSERLLAREVDALVLDGPAADKLVAAEPGKLVRLGEDLAAEYYALAMPPYPREEAAAISRAVEALAQRGFLKDLDSRYGLR